MPRRRRGLGRDLGGAVGRAVVDDQHVVAGAQQRRQHPRQRRRLVLDPQHGGVARPQPRRAGSRARRCRSRCGPRGSADRSPVAGTVIALAQRLADAAAHSRPGRPRAGRAGSCRPSTPAAASGAAARAGLAATALELPLDPLLGRDDGGPGDRLGLGVEVDVRLAQLVEGRVHVGGVAAGLGELVELRPGLLGELVQPRRQVEVGQALGHPAQPRVDEPVPVADLLAAWRAARAAAGAARPTPSRRGSSRRAGRRTARTPGRRPRRTRGWRARCAAACSASSPRGAPSRAGSRSTSACCRPPPPAGAASSRTPASHRADRRHPPQAEEPAQPRVLDDQLGVDREVALQPVGGADPLGLAGGRPGRSRTTRPGGRR